MKPLIAPNAIAVLAQAANQRVSKEIRRSGTVQTLPVIPDRMPGSRRHGWQIPAWV
jgi:hypothetical protein